MHRVSKTTIAVLHRLGVKPEHRDDCFHTLIWLWLYCGRYITPGQLQVATSFHTPAAFLIVDCY